ncbi:MAG: glycerophosphodiester phosphodiesterase family protein [Saprospiraceae bacterium]|nr:glycerophosphodiester phosphodiesterase family protein [Saprospiraceae bacterium]
MKLTESIDVQGHRGCRGLMPENTIPGFLYAVDLGVHTLEMDVVTSKDAKVIVSHDPFFHHDITLDPQGLKINTDGMKHNLFQLTLSEIQKYDVGSKGHPRFPEQRKIMAVKPSLDQVFDAVELHLQSKRLPPVQYSIEIKRKPGRDGIYHAPVAEFVHLVMGVIGQHGFKERCLIQSFDIETLQFIHQEYPEQRLVYLLENSNSFGHNMELLGFIPSVYSPDFKLLTMELKEEVQQAGMKLVPWTVNELEDIKMCLSLGVDGIISDYPDRVFQTIH